MLEDNIDFAIVLEDDIHLKKNFDNSIHEISL